MDGPPQDMTDGPAAHRWIDWHKRPRSESKKGLTTKRSSTTMKRATLFKRWVVSRCQLFLEKFQILRPL